MDTTVSLESGAGQPVVPLSASATPSNPNPEPSPAQPGAADQRPDPGANPPAVGAVLEIPPATTSAAPASLPSPAEAQSALPVLFTPKPVKPIGLSPVFRKMELLTPAEETEFQKWEAIVREGSLYVARVGEALATIRDKRLFRNDYDTFESYCRERWGFGRSQAYRYISAGEVQKTIALTSGLPLPAMEAQIRPLIGLSPQQVQSAWIAALSQYGFSDVPARLVRRAVKELLKVENPLAVSAETANRKQRSRLSQAVRTGMQDLLILINSGAAREAIISKFEQIQMDLEPLLTRKKAKL